MKIPNHQMRTNRLIANLLARRVTGLSRPYDGRPRPSQPESTDGDVHRTSANRVTAGVLLASVALIVGGASGCREGGVATGAGNRPAKTSADDVPRVRTVTVKPLDLEQLIQLPGTIEGHETVELFAKVGGFLETISVDIGDRVEKNQILAHLSIPEMGKELEQKQAAIAASMSDVDQALAAIRQAEAQVARAVAKVEEAKAELQEKKSHFEYREAEFKRISGLVDRGSVNRELLDEVKHKRSAAEASLVAVRARIRTAEAGLDAAKADTDRANTDHQRTLAYVDLAKADYGRVEAMSEYASIRAPFDGVVTKRMVDPGAFIQPAQGNSSAKPLLIVTRTDLVRIWLDLPMGQVRWLNKGDRAVLDRINVLPGEKFEGKVTRFATTLDSNSRMMRVEIDLKNDGQRLMPGYYGYVSLYLDQFKQTPVVPSSAMLAEGNERFVFVVQDGVCQKRTITTNYQDGTIIGVDSGLAAGEQVVRAGPGQLVDGQKVIGVGETSGT